MNPFSQILAAIDKLEMLGEERILLSIRNFPMREVSEVIQQIDDADARHVFHQASDEQNKSVKKILRALNLREENVRQMIQELKIEFKTRYFQ